MNCMCFINLILVLLLEFVPGVSFGTDAKPVGYITVTGNIAVQDALLNSDPVLKVYRGDGIGFSDNGPLKGSSYDIEIKNGRFCIRVPVDTRYSYLRFRLLKSVGFLSHGLPMVTVGDSLNLAISESGIVISGKNRLSWELQKSVFEARGTISLNDFGGDRVSRLFAMTDSLIKTSLAKLDFSVDRELQGVLSVNIEARYRMALLNNLYLLSQADSSLAKGPIKEALNKYFNVWAQVNDPLILNNVPQYLDGVVLYHQLMSVFTDGTDHKRFNQLYRELDEHSSGLLRDKLMSYLFWKKAGLNGDMQSLFFVEYAKIKDVSSKKVMDEILRTKIKGSVLPDFKFEGPDGRKVALTDFKGRLVVCHFWFTGCLACIQLKKNMEPVISKFKDSNVVFVNVDVDRTRDLWLKSVRGGAYTSPGEISLFSGGLGLDHPFIKWYGYTSFPKLIVVGTDGKLLSADFPLSADTESEKSFEAFIRTNKGT